MLLNIKGKTKDAINARKNLVEMGVRLELQPQVQPYVNPIQELVRVSHQMFHDSCVIPWDATLFGVDNGGIPLYIIMQDVFEIIQGNQLLNIAIIQLWICKYP